MQPVLYALPAVLLYALGNNFTSKYLRDSGIAANTFSIGLFMTVAAGCVLGVQYMSKAATTRLPSASLWWVYVVCGIIYCTADLLFYKAYALHGSLALLMTIVALMPAAAVVIEYLLFKGVAPSLRQSAGVICAILAVWLVSTR